MSNNKLTARQLARLKKNKHLINALQGNRGPIESRTLTYQNSHGKVCIIGAMMTQKQLNALVKEQENYTTIRTLHERGILKRIQFKYSEGMFHLQKLHDKAYTSRQLDTDTEFSRQLQRLLEAQGDFDAIV